MKIIVTTSNAYLHIVPIFIHLFQEYWGADIPVELVGYNKPSCELPPNFTFVSLGKQMGDAKSYGTDLRPYFERQDQYFIHLMEDTFIKAAVNRESLLYAENLIELYNSIVQANKHRTSDIKAIGRISLTNQNINQYAERFNNIMIATPDKSEFRLSTMPAIWNKDFLLRYLQLNMNPWEFECQDKVSDEFLNIAFEDRDSSILWHNEGVRKRNIHEYNFEGIDPVVLEQMKQKGII